MDWRGRFEELQRLGSYRSATSFLEEVAATLVEPAEQADALVAQATLLDDVFLRRLEAAQLYAQAAMLDSSRTDAVRRARFIHRSLGLLQHVAQSIEHELARTDDRSLAADLFKELGDARQDMLDLEGAAAAYDQALATVPDHSGAADAVEDVSAADEAAEARMHELARQGAANQGHAAAALLVRAARIARRLGDAGYAAFLEAAVRAVPLAVEPSFLLDNVYAGGGDLDGLMELNDRVIRGIEDPAMRAKAATDIAARWLSRFRDSDAAARFLTLAAEADPQALAAHVGLTQYYVDRQEWARALALVDGALERVNGGAGATELWLLGEGTELAWRGLGDRDRANAYAERLMDRAPNHPTLEAFLGTSSDEEQSSAQSRGMPSGASRAATQKDQRAQTLQQSDDSREAPVSDQDISTPAENDVREQDLPSDSLAETDASAVAESGGESQSARPLTPQEEQQLAELDEALEKFESQKRWSDYIKTILAKADIVTDPVAKTVLLCQAGGLYTEKSSNQAEAIKCYERVVEIDPRHLEAISHLKEMYERRRDWERLVRIMQSEAELLDPADRTVRYVEMAQLATERLRKPDICIELWQLVMANDPDHPDALAALANLYERARDWQPLADVLERLVQQGADPDGLKQQLQKLGMIYADKIGDDAGAVRAFKRLLEVDPDDRRAQEQLKRRYAALKAWDDLEEFYSTSDKWDELIRVFEREAESSEIGKEERIDLLFRAARLWIDRKDKKDRAARAYEKILDTDPENLDAALALSPIYEEANDARKLAAVYEVRLKSLDDPLARVQLLRETGLLYEERLRDPKTAFERYLEAFSVDPFQEIIREDVDRLAGQVDGNERVIEGYTRAIDDADSDQAAVALRISLAKVLTAAERVDDAIAQYQAVYDVQDDHQGAIAALGDLFRRTERFTDLLSIYERRIELEVDGEVRRQLAYERAALWETELDKKSEAIDAYRAILDEYGDGEMEAFRSLDRLYEAEGRWQDLSDVLERRIDIGPESDEEFAALKFRLGRVAEQHIENKPRSVELYREVLTILPEHDGARQALEDLLADADVGVYAAEILEPIYEVRGDWESLIRALLVLHAGAGDADRRLELLTKVGGVYAERLGDQGKSFDAFCGALRDAPDSVDTLAKLEILAVELERFKDLVALVAELAGQTSDPVLARRLWIKAAEMSDSQLNDVDGAVSAFQKVLDIDPGDLDVLLALETLFRRTERYRDLLTVLRRRSEHAVEPGDKESLLLQMASIHDELLQQPDEAISVHKEVLELDPTSAAALSALDALFERQELWSDLADNVDRQLSMATDPNQQIAFMLRLADLREKRMNATEAAIEIYRDVLDREPQEEAALAALERLIQQDEHQLLIAEILEPLYRDANQFEKLIQIHETQAVHASSPERRVELLHRIAELYEVALDNLELAFRSHARALAEDPGNLATQEHLERIARAAGAFEDLAKTYEERVDHIEDPQLAASLHVKAAIVREEQLGDMPGAIGHYQRVLDLDNQHIDAATALERLFQLSERYEDLANIYLTKAAMLSSLDEQKDYYFRAASIHEELLERPLDAITVYDKVLENDPEDLHSLDKLIELYLRLERWEPLLGIYTRKADIVVDPDEKKRLFVEVGAVYEREVGDTEKAIDTYTRILEIDPDDMVAISRLDALYQATENWQELLSVLEREADLAGDPNEVISYRYRIAELWHHRLDDATRAVDIYRDILEILPDHEPTLAALEAMVSEGKDPVAAAGVLEPVYRQSGEWAKLISIHEVQIAHEEDPIRKCELLHQVAELYEFHLDQPQNAFDAFARALPADSENEQTLGSLERLAELLQAWGLVTQLYDAEINKIAELSPDRVVDMALRTAQIYEVQVGDVTAAIDRYRLVVDADDTHVQAIESLDRLYEATERWSDLAAILHKEIVVASSPDDILAYQFRLGQVYQERLGDVGQAIEQYREILAAAPEHGPSLAALELLFADGVQPLQIGDILEPLYRMAEAWDRLLNVHEIQLQYQGDPAERVAMMHRIAEIGEDKAGDHPRAFLWMQRALLEDPADDHTHAEAERLASILDGWGQLANTYADVVEHGTSVETRADVGKKLARVYEEELGDIVRAEETYRVLVGISDRDDEVLAALDRIYVEHGAHDALAAVLRKRIAATEHPDDQVELNFRLGQVLENDLRHTDEAIQVYSHVIADLDTQHAESIRALEDIYTNRQDWPHLFATFEKELEVVVGDSMQADILAKMARLASDCLDEPVNAIEIWRRVLDLRGEDPEALNALGDIYARQENWRDLVDILEREVSIAEDDSFRIRVYADLGRIWYEKLERDRNALDSWERVLDIDPGNADALFAIAEIHRAANQHVELVDTLNRIIEVGAATLDDATLESVYMQLGFLYASELQQPPDAVDSYNHALDVNPGNFQAMDALEAIHREEAQWEECIAIMERRATALEEPQQKIAVLLAIAAMWAEQVENPDRGTSAFQRVLELEPMHEKAFTRLDELHRQAMRWEDLIEMYLGRVEATEDTAESVGLLRKVAGVYEAELNDPGEAFDALQIAWTQDFSNRETSEELERVAGLTQKWNELLTSANESLQQIEDPATKIAICLHCARWYGQELGHPEYAIPYYQQILALDPANVAAMQQMAELYRTTQQWQTLAQVLGRLVEMTTDGTVKADTYVQMGELCEQQLGVPEQAGGYYQRALNEDPDNIGALEALERIFRSQENWNELLGILKRKATALEQTGDMERVLPAKLQVAETYEDRLGQPDAAIATYKDVLTADPINLPALKGLERLYAQRERWQELLQVLETQFEIVSLERDRIAILVRLAAMWEEEFVKPDKAAERLEQVLDIDTTHEEALIGLERLYHHMQRWDELIRTFERHVSATPDRGEKARVFRAMGEVYSHELDDQDRAIDSYLSVLDLNDADVEALNALTHLYERRGEHSSALDMMAQMSRLVQDPVQQVDLCYRMGRILDEHLGDRATALDNFQRALDVEPGHLPSLEAMRLIHIDGGDWLAAAKILREEAAHTESPRVIAERLVELGQVLAERLDEPEEAIEAYEGAHREDPDNEAAALPLVDEYYRTERWGEAFPLLEMLVKRSGKREADEQHRLAFLLGEVAGHLGQDDEAIKALGRAYQLDSTHLPSLFGLAAAYYRVKDWEKAFKFYQMLLVHHRDSLGREEITDIFYRLGVIKREQGERRKALNMFDKALEEDGYHRLTLEAVVGLYETQGEWEQVIHFKKQILETSNSEDERFDLLDVIGDLWKDRVKNQQKAIQAYSDASDLKPDDHRILHKLLISYQETKQWEKAIEMIQRISDLDGRAPAQSKYLYTIGVILRDELKDGDAAIEKFNESLDLDSEQLKAFEAINKLVTQRKDWKGLERAFRKMLHRVVGKGQTELEFNLWHNLGVIYRDRQHQFDNAAEAFRMASSLQPDHATEHQILAELYAMIPERVGDAIEEHQWLLRHDPYKVDSYRALYKLYFDARAYDKAWCLAATLTFLKKADAEQQQFFEQYRQAGVIRPRARVDNERWVKDLFHPDEDLFVSKIFEALAPAVHAAKQSTDKALGLSKKHQVDPAASTVAAARSFGFAAQVLNLPIVPRLFLRPDVQGGLTHVAGSAPPAAVCGATLLSGFSPQDLTFVVARHLAFYRSEHFIRTLLSSNSELKAVLLAGLRLANVAPGDPQIDQFAAQLQTRLQANQLDALGSVCRRFMEAGGSTDIKKWMQAVELTGCRAGFLLCNDLETAARMVQALPPEGPADLPPKEKIKELVLFSVSESYFRLREALGIQIKV